MPLHHWHPSRQKSLPPSSWSWTPCMPPLLKLTRQRRRPRRLTSLCRLLTHPSGGAPPATGEERAPGDPAPPAHSNSRRTAGRRISRGTLRSTPGDGGILNGSSTTMSSSSSSRGISSNNSHPSISISSSSKKCQPQQRLFPEYSCAQVTALACCIDTVHCQVDRPSFGRHVRVGISTVYCALLADHAQGQQHGQIL